MSEAPYGALYDRMHESLMAAAETIEIGSRDRIVFEYLRAQILQRYDAATGCMQVYPHGTPGGLK